MWQCLGQRPTNVKIQKGVIDSPKNVHWCVGSMSERKIKRPKRARRSKNEDRPLNFGPLWVLLGAAIIVWALAGACDATDISDYDAAAGRILMAFGGVALACRGVARLPRVRRWAFGLGALSCCLLLLVLFLSARGREQTTVGVILLGAVGIGFGVDRVLRRATLASGAKR
jgi:peptidoglycan/LPS O-acetylase OafA/YrhL